MVTTKTLRRRFFSLAGRLTRSARRLTLHLPKHWPWKTQFSRALARLRALVSACLTAPTAPDPSHQTDLSNLPIESHRRRSAIVFPCMLSRRPRPSAAVGTAIGAPNDNQRPPPAPFIGIERGPSHPTALIPLSQPQGRSTSVDWGYTCVADFLHVHVAGVQAIEFGNHGSPPAGTCRVRPISHSGIRVSGVERLH